MDATPVQSRLHNSGWYFSPWLWAIVFMAIGFVLRLPGLLGDLWLDEVWSVLMAEQTPGIGTLFTDSRFHYDNNHWLNTIWLYLVRGFDKPAVYRGLSLVSGLAVIPVGMLLVSGRWAQWFAGAFLACCYALIHYSTEARGYMPAIFFTLAAVVAINRYILRPRVSMALLFSALCLLAVLSHLTFLYAYAAIVIWSMVRLKDSVGLGRVILRHMVRCHAVPLMAIALLWVASGRHLVVAGGDAMSFTQFLVQYWAEMTGRSPASMSANVAVVLSLILAFIVIVAIAANWRDTRRSGLLWLLMVMMPVAFWLVVRPPFLYPRYFLLVVPFLLVAVAGVLGQLASVHRAVAGVLVGLVVVFGVMMQKAAGRIDRGQYSQIVREMAAMHDGAVIAVSGDSNFRHKVMLDYFVPRIAPAVRFDYTATPAAPAQFMLKHSFRTAGMPDRAGWPAGYVLRATTTFSGITGFTTDLFIRDELSPAAAQQSGNQIPLQDQE